MKLLIFVFSICVMLTMGLSCSDTWSSFKTVEEGPFYVKADTRLFHFNVLRKTEYVCYNASVRFRTQRLLIPDDYIYKTGDISVGLYYRSNSGFGECEKTCSEKQETILVRYLKIRRKYCGTVCDSFVDKTM